MNSQPNQAMPQRRNFVKTAMVAAAGVAALGVLNPRRALAVSPALSFENDIPGTGDVKVINYALALEDLESDLYAQALMRLTTGGTNALGTTIPGLGVSADALDVEYVQEFGQVETEHAALLRGTLQSAGAPTISPFKYDFNIQNLSRRQVDLLIRTAEAIGVSAYLGAIPFFATRTYLQIAGAIEGTEARHTAVITKIFNDLFNDDFYIAPPATRNNAIDQPAKPNAVLAKVSPFIVTGG